MMVLERGVGSPLRQRLIIGGGEVLRIGNSEWTSVAGGEGSSLKCCVTY